MKNVHKEVFSGQSLKGKKNVDARGLGSKSHLPTGGNNKSCELAVCCGCWRGVLCVREGVTRCQSVALRQLRSDGLPRKPLCRYLYVNSCGGSDGSAFDDFGGVVEQAAGIRLQDQSFTERDERVLKVTIDCFPSTGFKL